MSQPAICEQIYYITKDKLNLSAAEINNIRSLALSGSVPMLATTASLTPVQQHADELLKIVKGFQSAVNNVSTSQMTALLHTSATLINKIEPKPPTLDEALNLLRAVDIPGTHPDIGSFLDRARAAGLL